MAAEGLLTFDELRAKLTELDEVREAAERELSIIQKRVEHLESLEQDKDTLLASLEETVPEALDELTAEERRQLYEMVKLRLTAGVDGTLELNGKLGAKRSVCTSETTRAACQIHTTMAEPPTCGR